MEVLQSIENTVRGEFPPKRIPRAVPQSVIPRFPPIRLEIWWRRFFRDSRMREQIPGGRECSTDGNLPVQTCGNESMLRLCLPAIIP